MQAGEGVFRISVFCNHPVIHSAASNRHSQTNGLSLSKSNLSFSISSRFHYLLSMMLSMLPIFAPYNQSTGMRQKSIRVTLIVPYLEKIGIKASLYRLSGSFSIRSGNHPSASYRFAINEQDGDLIARGLIGRLARFSWLLAVFMKAGMLNVPRRSEIPHNPV